MTAPAPPQWENRIVGDGDADPAELIANPRNWRTHPDNQRAALTAVLGRVGWVQKVVVNRRSGFVVDGHLRVAVAVERGEASLPVVYVDLDDEEEGIILATFDPIGAMASRDDAIMASLLADVGITGNDTLDALLARLRADEEPAPLPPLGPSLLDRFLVPPFSVLDARQGYWQERKRQWIALGIRSEIGRGENLLGLTPAEERALGPGGLRAYQARLAPGGAPLPAAKLGPNGHTERGDGRGRRLTWAAGAERHDETSAKILAGGRKDDPDGATSGTSIFDPVLCELAYRWFSPEGGVVIDPFAGGSVRGVVAAILGRSYHGIDLSEGQIAANREQWDAISETAVAGIPPVYDLAPMNAPTNDPEALTPVERRGSLLIKRDDLFQIGPVNGGKTRTVYRAALRFGDGLRGIVTGGGKGSRRVNVVAQVARYLGVPAHIHTPTGSPTAEMLLAVEAGALRITHRPGYLTVLQKRAEEDAREQGEGWCYAAFGGQSEEAVEESDRQTDNLPFGEFERMVVTAGSGTVLAGILRGLRRHGWEGPVIGVMVGHDAADVLGKYAPPGWEEQCTLIKPETDFMTPLPDTRIEGILLDAYYEAKAAAYAEPGDLFWIVGLTQAQTASARRHYLPPAWYEGDALDRLAEMPEADLVFTCPPYGDLERYSDDPRDISNMDYPAFVDALRRILALSASRLRDNRFVVLVVGDFRGPDGSYRGFVGDTVEAASAAGLMLYNDAVLVTAVGSLSIRAGRYFSGSRKLGKSHQNVLVFAKGDARRAHAELGPISIPEELLAAAISEEQDE